ncbi:hypothetical protein AVEN_209039-1 [Araneus ventricosus]|uniref:Uncharacterized protein n=1 Tax=Araneus ventricosus TaxID=182803 RepID=A0A4Y2KIL7_ARAVE|nr:hypothetical protein AVEN_209039-1 [Araneus ventricosus]
MPIQVVTKLQAHPGRDSNSYSYSWQAGTLTKRQAGLHEMGVGGSIRVSNTEETATESRRGSIAKEESALEKTSRRRAREKMVIWKTFKSIVFLICLIFLIIQSVEFFSIYYKYPTTIVTEVTVAKEFKLPAITLCFRNTISFKDFCSYEPDQCVKPSNMEEFCRNHPILCSEDTSNLTVPVQDSKTREIMKRYLYNDSYNDDELFRSYNSDKSIPILRSNSFSGGFSDEFRNSLICLRV